ncbi:hypothetical protein KQ940_13545 [Marinobacterium sp. D7]|uniref:hypothetical protein n=1 Tax=Marinobacterium ramblicola TaxID=2849041 RepID=UPI001C2D1940|nr:hypothetical protein [Marinobacterium ramblicola]MBV1789077.1 hypothetical protein [Marinobacterium ramblicola]
MLNRSTRWSFSLAALLCAVTTSGMVQAAGQQPSSKYSEELDYLVIEVGAPAPLPEVTVIEPSAPLPVHEIVVEPVKVKPLTGEDLVFAQIERDAKLPTELDLLPEGAPGPELTPPPPFGTHRNVIEL